MFSKPRVLIRSLVVFGAIAVVVWLVMGNVPALAEPFGLDPATLPTRGLIDHLRPLDHHSAEARNLLMALYLRFSLPCATLVAALVATPLGIMFARHGAYIGTALSIIIVFLYYTASQTSRALGDAGYLAPLLAAWLPNIVFGLVGAGLMTRVERI